MNKLSDDRIFFSCMSCDHSHQVNIRHSVYSMQQFNFDINENCKKKKEGTERRRRAFCKIELKWSVKRIAYLFFGNMGKKDIKNRDRRNVLSRKDI